MQQSMHQEMVRLSVFTALVMTFALTWGSPFLTGRSVWAQQQSEQPAPDQNQKQSATFTGTVVRSGSQFILHDASGTTYSLDDTERVKSFEGKTVKVIGRLDQEAKMIHVEEIEAITT